MSPYQLLCNERVCNRNYLVEACSLTAAGAAMTFGLEMKFFKSFCKIVESGLSLQIRLFARGMSSTFAAKFNDAVFLYCFYLR